MIKLATFAKKQMQNKSISIDRVLSEAFRYWRSTIKYQVIFSLIYFSLLFIFSYYLFNRFGLMEPMRALSKVLLEDQSLFMKKATELAQQPNTQSYILYMIIAKAVIYPLNIGFYQIYRNMDEKLPISLDDLFVGFKGVNFFRYFGYALFWGMIALYANSLLPLGIVWVLITLFNAPLMFFMDKGIFDSIVLNFKVLKTSFIAIIVGVLIAFLFSYAGALLFILGYAFTFPFWNAMIYTLYKNLFNEIN